jgi:hypothetical protein
MDRPVVARAARVVAGVPLPATTPAVEPNAYVTYPPRRRHEGAHGSDSSYRLTEPVDFVKIRYNRSEPN